jgi:SAM-dependent methyltransferase
MTPRRDALRETFEEVPELYDRARPVYPRALLDDLVDLTDLPKGGRILEIGPGTGQATLPLAERGFLITGIELGEGLASVARRKLRAYRNVEIIHGAFEAWKPLNQPFDAVVAFTAFHWLDPEVRFKKAAEILREAGALAIVTTKHVRVAGGDDFWVDVQQDYDAIDPSDDNAPPPHPDDVKDIGGEIAASGYFENIASRRYLWDVVYTADEYINVLDTYSGHRRIEPERRQRLYDAIRRRIEARPDRNVTKTYLAILNVAQLNRSTPIDHANLTSPTVDQTPERL